MKSYKVRNESGETFEVDEDKLSDAEKDGFLPVVSNGEEEHRVSPSDMQKAMADGFHPLGQEPKNEGSYPLEDYVIEPTVKALSPVLKPLGFIGNRIDRYTGAPVRAAASSLQASGDEPIVESLKKAAQRAYEQFGEPQEVEINGKTVSQVPTWGEIVSNADIGVPEKRLSEYGVPVKPHGLLDTTPANMIGMGIGAGTDLTPVYLSGAGKLLKGGAKFSEALSDAGQVAKEAVSNVISKRSPMRDVPTSFGEMADKLSDTGNLDLELPSAARLKEIEQVVPDMEFKPLDIHRKMLESEAANTEAKTAIEMLPQKQREIFDRYNQAMKSEIENRIKGKAGALAQQNIVDAKTAGKNLMNYIDTAYQANKERLGPMFKDLQENLEIPREDHVNDLVTKIAASDPDVANMIRIDEDGMMTVRPNSLKSGLSPKEHSFLSQIANDVNDGTLTFKEMQRMRESLRKAMDPMNPRETKALQNIRSAMLDHMENMVNEYHPSQDMRGIFRDWAKNEKMLDDMSDLLGGKVGGFDEAMKATPELALNKIFANSKTLNTAAQHLPKDVMENLTGQYIGKILEDSKSSDQKTLFSSAKLAQNLKRSKPVLDEIDPGLYRELSALNDLSRIIPDGAKVNPSGSGTFIYRVLVNAGVLSAPSAYGLLMGFKEGGVARASVGLGLMGGKMAFDKAKKMIAERQAISQFEDLLGKPKGQGLLTRAKKYGPSAVKGSAVYEGNKER